MGGGVKNFKKLGDINYRRPLMVRKSKETFTYFRTESLISLRGKYIELSKINILHSIVFLSTYYQKDCQWKFVQLFENTYLAYLILLIFMK